MNDNVRAVLERPLKVGTHHGIVDHNDRVGALLLDHSGDCGNIAYLKQRVRGTLEKYHSSFAGVQEGYD